MAGNIVGDAYVIVRAITSNVERDIKNSFKDIGGIGESIGEQLASSVEKGLASSGGGGADGLFSSAQISGFKAAQDTFQHLTRLGYVLAPALAAVSSIIGVILTGLVSLASVIIAGAIPAVLNLAGALGALAIAGAVAKLAFSGVAEAIQAGNKAVIRSASDIRAYKAAQLALSRAVQDYNILTRDGGTLDRQVELARRSVTDATYNYAKAVRDAQHALRDLAFDSEDASIKEKKAAIDLEKARETLARVSDLPPNSRARKEAELAFAESDLNYRRSIEATKKIQEEQAINNKMGPDFKSQVAGQREVVLAKRDEADATLELKKTLESVGIERERATKDLAVQEYGVKNYWALTSSASAYADALAKLSPEAQDFVKFIVALTPEIKKLKEAAGSELFPKLETAISNLVTLFPILTPLIAQTGSVLGDVAIKISKVFTEPENVERIKSIWSSSNVSIGLFGDAIGNLIDVLLILWSNLSPYIERFALWTKTLTASWKETLKADEKSGKLKDTLDKLYGVLDKLKKIFGNVFGGLGKLILENIGPGSGGDKFLNYFIDLSEKFKNMKTIDGKGVKSFFSDAADNGIKLLGVLGDIIFAFIRLADNKGFGQFLDSVKAAVAVFSSIGEDMDGALPSVGKMILSFANFTKLVTDPNSITIFFDTIRKGLDGVIALLNTDIGKKILDISNTFLPVMAAITLSIDAAYFAFKVIAGAIATAGAAIIAFGDILAADVELWTTTWGGLSAVVTAPFWAVAAAVAAVVAIFIGAYENSEKLRHALSDVGDLVKGAITDAFTTIKNVIHDAFPQDSIDGLKAVLKSIGDWIATYVVPIFKVTLKGAIDIVAGAFKGLIYLFADIKAAFKVMWNLMKVVLDAMHGDFGGAGRALSSAFGGAIDMVRNGFKSLSSIIVPILNTIISAFNATFGKIQIKIPSWVPGIGGKTFGIPEIPKIPGFGDNSTEKYAYVGSTLTKLAKGGIIQPKSGGVMAQLAEAGRAERVEPLDPDGLSKRDKAMIQLLAGGVNKGDVTVNVYPSPGMDERELAAMVSRQITSSIRSGS